MDVRLSPEHQALRDSAAQVVDRFGVRAVGQLDDDERRAKLDAAVAAAGWRELRVADEDGAPLATGVEAAIVTEELARGLADSALVGPLLASDLRRRAGAPPARASETVALTADLGALATADDGAAIATADDGAAIATDALGADAALVLVRADHGFVLGSVPVTDAAPHTDLTRAMGDVAPSAAVIVPDQQRPLADTDITAWAALGLALATADLVGTMRGAVALACEYAKERRQYGTPIGSFQAVQHLLADAHVALEGSRSVALHAAWAVDALAPDDALASAALAKAYAARAARTVGETSIQVHGGIGNTWECLAHLHLRRALLSTDLLGGTGPCLARVLEHNGIGGSRGLR